MVEVSLFAGELGGFARSPKEIDGDFEAYNFCLAESYLIAMGGEDWDALGDIDTDLIDDVAYWLNYDGKIGEDRKNIIEKIPMGLIMTDNDRTFVDAIVAERKVKLARTFILNGSRDPRLYLTAMLYDTNDIVDDSLLNLVHKKCYDSITYTTFLNSVFEEIEGLYISFNEMSQQKMFLMKVKPFIEQIRFPEGYQNNPELIRLAQFDSFSWQKRMKKQKNNK